MATSAPSRAKSTATARPIPESPPVMMATFPSSLPEPRYSGGHDDLAIQNGAVGASVLVSTKLTSTLEPQLLWIQYFREGGGLVRPRLNWNAATNLTLSAGLDIFTGPADGFFGRYDNRDRVYGEMRYAF